SNNQLESLPEWENAVEVSCSFNKLKSLPCWKNIEIVDCSHNQLENLPEWKNIKYVHCLGNKIESLPEWKTLIFIDMVIKTIDLSTNEMSNGDCFICSLENQELYKCKTCIFLSCKPCITDWFISKQKENCMYCNSKFY